MFYGPGCYLSWWIVPVTVRRAYILLWLGEVVNKAEVVVFLELSCFSYDPVDVGNLISGSSAFSFFFFLIYFLFF